MAAVRSVRTTSQRGADDGAGQGHLCKMVIARKVVITVCSTYTYLRTRAPRTRKIGSSRQLDGVHFWADARAAGGARDPLQVGEA